MTRRSRITLVVAIALLVVVAAVLVVVRGPGDGTDEATRPRTTTSAPTTTWPPSTTASTTEPSTTEPPTTERPGTLPPPPPTTIAPPPPATRPPGPATVVSRGPADRRVVALTFDAGSDTGYAAAILDTLRARGVPASFGITGVWARANPALVARMAAEGHQLINHSDTHPSFTGYSTGAGPLSYEARRTEVERAETAIVAAAGVGARPWFRPPYGDIDASVRADLGSMGYAYIAMWTVDSLGWKGIAAAEIAARCLSRAEPGAIYLFHVGAASADAAALGSIIDGLRAQGYGFATLQDLIAP